VLRRQPGAVLYFQLTNATLGKKKNPSLRACLQRWVRKNFYFYVAMKKEHLSREQRYTISVMHRHNCTQKMIAATIGKDKSVVCRELKRNARLKGAYSFEYAQGMADLRKERMKRSRKLLPSLKKEIIAGLQQDWSPQQIEGRMKLTGDPTVSHETIYKLIRRDRELGGTLYLHTRHRLKHRKRSPGSKIPVKNRAPIDQRPDIVDAKGRFGDWKIDAIVGENNRGAVVTLVERKSAFYDDGETSAWKERERAGESRRQDAYRIPAAGAHHYRRQRNGAC
jgi:IS30 family transposase